MSSSLDKMKKRAGYDGYDLHDNLNVKGKFNSFKSSLRNSYHAEWITFNDKKYRCLINPDKLKENYDQKEISISFNAGMKNGDTFYWDRTGHHWLVYLQDYNEEAYFRASIRRCDYQINGYWVYLRGPVETALIWRQKHQIEFNELNYSILFYVEKNEETCEYFSRLNTIKFDGHNWRVAATDKYSQDGIIEVYLEEYFDNKMEDAAAVPEIAKPDITQPYIDGPRIVRPYDTNLSYSIVGFKSGKFVVDSNKVKINEMTDTSCKLEILTGKAGSFNLIYQPTEGEDIVLNVNIKTL